MPTGLVSNPPHLFRCLTLARLSTAPSISPYTPGADWLGISTNAWLGTRWLGIDAEKAAVQREFDEVAAWAYWELLAAGFGIYDPLAKAWRMNLLKALIPSAQASTPPH
jgi:hypothetical protein